MKRHFLFICFFLTGMMVWAREIPAAYPSDMAKADSIISLLSEEKSLGDKIALAAQSLVGCDQDDYYVTDSVASLRINLNSFSPLMLVNHAVALAKTSQLSGLKDLTSLFNQLENIACRQGENTGFTSIMFHSSDWIGDNVSRGNLREFTEDYSGMVARTKSLDEMTRYREKFAALADSSVFETVRMTELGFRTHRIPTLKKEIIKKKEVLEDLRNGDVLILVPNRDGIDYYDIGIISIQNGTPHLIHVSPSTHKVVIEKDDLARYMSLVTKHFQGFRLLRFTD